MAIIGTRDLQVQGQVIPAKGKTQAIYGEPIQVERVKDESEITHERLREITDQITKAIQQMSGQEYVDEYAQTVKERMRQAAKDNQANKQ